jgi:transcription antitermination factor NusG
VADQISFTPGDRVELVGGPFAKFRGNVKEVDQTRQRLLVILEMGKANAHLVKPGSEGLPVECGFQEVKKVAS